MPIKDERATMAAVVYGVLQELAGASGFHDYSAGLGFTTTVLHQTGEDSLISKP